MTYGIDDRVQPKNKRPYVESVEDALRATMPRQLVGKLRIYVMWSAADDDYLVQIHWVLGYYGRRLCRIKSDRWELEDADLAYLALVVP